MLRGSADLGETVEITGSNEEDELWGSRVSNSGQAFIKRGDTDSGSQEFKMTLNTESDKRVPPVQYKRGTGDETGDKD